MEDIFQKNGRVESVDGMRFYEQDIVMLNYVYTGDVTIDTEVDYCMPGFGFVFASCSAGLTSADEARKALLAKVGSLDFSVYSKNLGVQTRVYNSSCPIMPDKTVHKFRFRKTGTYIYCYELVNEKEQELGHFNTKQNIDKFYIGIYSNKDNVVKSMDIFDNRPQHWFTSIQNTNGGRISFAQNTLQVEQAEKDAEIDQELIYLKKGRYFLDYKAEPVDGVLDKRVYIFNSSEPRIKAPEKNMLKNDELLYGAIPYFDIDKDTYINLLWQIKSGRISNIAIKDDCRQDFVSTDESVGEKPGSYILLKLKDLKKAEWFGVVERIPISSLTQERPYSLFSYAGNTLDLDTAMVKLDMAYHYVFEKTATDTWVLTITEDFGDEPEQVYKCAYKSTNPSARIFDSVAGRISSLSITKENGETIDIINQRSIRKIVPTSIKSPIIVTDKNNIPMDLSASYRILPDGKYLFTNYEREIFDVEQELKLKSAPCEVTDVVLFGVRGEIDKTGLYKIRDEAMVTDISGATEHYDIIGSDLFKLVDEQILRLDESLLHMDYDMFIVDYLKNNSYCINASDKGTEYIVDIITESSVINTLYDMGEDGQVRAYKIDEKLKPSDNSYLVLRKDEMAP